jgi:1-acyl-sn-glycerol-3-phosphate acyltransferase
MNGVDRRAVSDRWGHVPRETGEAKLFRAACRSWFRTEWEGLERIPEQGGALIVSNHAGLMPIDGGILKYGIEEALDRSVFALAHHGFWRFPFAGPLLNRMGGVVGHPENAHRLLCEENALVLVFPEGEKGPVKPTSERYRLQRFGRGGFVETAMRAGVPIVPVALMGTEDTTPVIGRIELGGRAVPITLNALLFGPLLGAFAHFPAKIRVRVLEPVRFDERPGQLHYPRSVLMAHSERIRGNLQSALDEMLGARASRWWG